MLRPVVHLRRPAGSDNFCEQGALHMTAHVDGITPQQGRISSAWLPRALRFVVFLACALLVFAVFSHYYPLFEGSRDLWGRVAVTLVFLGAGLLARLHRRTEPYWRVLFAFGTACAAISLDYYLGLSKWLLPAMRLRDSTPAGWAIDKLESSLLGVLVVIVLTLASRQTLVSLYLRRGRLWLGLAVGLGAMLIMMALSIPMAQYLYDGRDLSWSRVLPWTPWLLIFVLANAFNEELLFRGLLLGRLEPFVGKFAANLLVAIPFTLMHSGVGYASSLNLFLLGTFAMALAWGWLAQKTRSLWGSILFHAAMDIAIVVGIFSQL
jgi:membrane protease YdiL (CAAX protease family)